MPPAILMLLLFTTQGGVSSTVGVFLSTDAHVIRLGREGRASRTWRIAVDGIYQGDTIGIDLAVFLLAAQP